MAELPTVREPERLRPWLIAIAANEARQHLRANKRRRVREITPLMPESEPGGIDSGMPSADQMDLSAVLVRPDPSDRQLLAMRYLAGLTAEEIGLAHRTLRVRNPHAPFPSHRPPTRGARQ